MSLSLGWLDCKMPRSHVSLTGQLFSEPLDSSSVSDMSHNSYTYHSFDGTRQGITEKGKEPLRCTAYE